MKKNWYAVYTMPNQERRVAAILSRKGIHNFYPVNTVQNQSPSFKKMVSKPLFTSYVFVFISEVEMARLKRVNGIVNFVYWMSKPVIICTEEISVLQQFTSIYNNIRLEKSPVNTSDSVRVIEDPVISFKENAASIRFHKLRIKLPTLGYTLIAEREKAVDELVPSVTHTSIFTTPVNTHLSN